MRKRTVTPIQDMKKKCIAILNQKKVRLINYETSMRNPDSSLEIYLTTSKVNYCRLMDENRREKEEEKKETAKKTLI